MGTKSALGNKRQLTNQIAGKDASLFFSFLGRHRVVLNKGTDGCMESTFVIPQDGYVTKYGIFTPISSAKFAIMLDFVKMLEN